MLPDREGRFKATIVDRGVAETGPRFEHGGQFRRRGSLLPLLSAVFPLQRRGFSGVLRGPAGQRRDEAGAKDEADQGSHGGLL